MKKLPWAIPAIGNEELREVTSAVKENWLSMGPRTLRFEEMLMKYSGRKYALACANGTVALELALRLLDIKPGDEVILPAMTYVATAAAVVNCGAIPVFADSEKDYPTISPEKIEPLITKKTKLIATMDYGGIACRHDLIKKIAKKHKLKVLHDAAQSMGGYYRNKSLLAYGDVATTSFHAAKSITCIEGGMVFGQNATMDKRARILRNQGEDPKQKYIHIEVGYNYRLSDLHAAVGIAQMKRVEKLLAKRRRLAEEYSKILSGVTEVGLPPERKSSKNGWFFYPVRIPNRDKVAQEMRRNGVDTRIAYPHAIYDQPAYKKWKRKRCPNAEKFAREVLNLPLFNAMTLNDVKQAAGVMVKAMGV